MWKKKGTDDIGINDRSPDKNEIVLERKRILGTKPLLIVNIICFAMTVFHLYASGIRTLPVNVFRCIHLGFGMCIVFLIYPASKKEPINKIPWRDVLFAALATVPNIYIIVELENLAKRAGILTTMDLVMGIILIVLLLEVSRRVVGIVLTCIATFFILYTILGPYFPGILAHRGASLAGLVRHMYLSTEGVYGVPLGASASFIFLFVVLGTILTHIGAGDVLINLALSVFGKQRGGPAKVAVVSSALFGSISGSSLANVVTTGTFTIPLMKKVGYEPSFAGAVEAAASTGGQIMPPIMGAAAFIIAEFLGIPYFSVCLAAALPAVLYFTAIFCAVHQQAVKLGIKGLTKDQVPSGKKVLKEQGYLLLPLVLIIVILVMGYSPAMAGFVSILTAVAISWFKRETRLTPKRLFFVLAEGAKGAMDVLIACAVVGFIIGSFTLSGMGLKMAALVQTLSGGRLFLTLLFTAIASIILGMGVPTTANYIMMAMITVPIVSAMDVLPLAAHLFCFYFGIVSDLTPPVALGALTASGIAGSKFLPTAINATKLGAIAYIIPFFFVYNPILLLGMQPFTIEVLISFIFAIIGTIALSCAIYNYMLDTLKWYERIITAIAALIMIHPNILTSFIGISLFILVYLMQRKSLNKALYTT